jgi:hypothetical protein
MQSGALHRFAALECVTGAQLTVLHVCMQCSGLNCSCTPPLAPILLCAMNLDSISALLCTSAPTALTQQYAITHCYMNVNTIG